MNKNIIMLIVVIGLMFPFGVFVNPVEATNGSDYTYDLVITYGVQSGDDGRYFTEWSYSISHYLQLQIVFEAKGYDRTNVKFKIMQGNVAWEGLEVWSKNQGETNTYRGTMFWQADYSYSLPDISNGDSLMITLVDENHLLDVIANTWELINIRLTYTY